MTTKLFLVFLSVLAGVMVGLALSKRLSIRESYFDEFVRLVVRLISDISFSQQKIEMILSEYLSANQHMEKNLIEYRAFLRGGELALSRGHLTKREHRIVTEFFTRLGSLDLTTQIEELNNQKYVFEEMFAFAKDKNRSYGRALIKLGFLAGLLIGILLL